MKLQQIISDTNSKSFDQRVNKALSDGWKIVEGTLKTSAAVSSHWAEWFGGRTETYYSNTFTVALEKEFDSKDNWQSENSTTNNNNKFTGQRCSICLAWTNAGRQTPSCNCDK